MSEFHFIRPIWLVALTLPLVGLRPVGAFGYLLWLHRPARLTFGAVQ